MLDDEKTIKWLLKHRVDGFGNINLCGLDFRAARRGVNFSNIKVRGNLYQNNQKVEGDLIQCYQHVEGDLIQDSQIVDKNLYQSGQSVKGDLISHKLPPWEHWEDYEDLVCGKSVIRKRNLKPITREELKKMGYVLKEDE